MLLSEREMGLSDDHEGIVELPGDTETGSSAVEALGQRSDHRDQRRPTARTAPAFAVSPEISQRPVSVS